MSDITEVSEKEFQLGVLNLVGREFEKLKALPDDVAEVPIIGGEFNPHDPEEVSHWQQRAIRALLAQRWWQKEGPPWAQPLPLRLEDCYISACLHRGLNTRRAMLLAHYSQDLRGKGYRLENAIPFEEFCAQTLAPR